MSPPTKAILAEYDQLLSTVHISNNALDQATVVAKQICANSPVYYKVIDGTSVPWQFIGTLHHMECGGNFRQHLANGDPITAPTVQEPVGIPAGTWIECAIAILNHKSKQYLSTEVDWGNMANWLWAAEKYNGWGYRLYHSEVNSPYLWSGTNHYTAGKYVADGKWDSNAVSEQVGAVPILMGLGVSRLRSAIPDQAMAYRSAMEKTYKDASQKRGIIMPAAIGHLNITNETALKIGEDLKPRADLKPEEKIDLQAGQVVEFDRLENENDRSHYKIHAIKIRGQDSSAPAVDIDYSAWVYLHDAGLKMNSTETSNESSASTYSPLTISEPAKAVDPSDKKGIQEELIRIGLLDGVADGRWGSITASAYRAARRSLTGSESDTIDAAFLQKLARYPSATSLKFKAKDPSNPENILAVKLVERMVELKMQLNISMGSSSPTYNIVYVSGTNPDGSKNKDSIDNWNDLRFLIQIAQDGTVLVPLCKVGTIDAGTDWRENPMNSLGCAQIDKDKQFLSAWCVGRHGSRQYPALVQCGEITITRDYNKSGLRDAADKHYSGSDFGINQHHGYDSDRVGQMSAGCLVARSIAGHEQFMALLRKDRRYQCNNGYAWSTAVLSALE